VDGRGQARRSGRLGDARLLAVGALLGVAIAGLWAGTQWVAAGLGEAPGLGRPWITLGAVRVYAPWAWLGWEGRLEGRAPGRFREAGAMALGAVLVGCVGPIAAALGRKRAAPSEAHGSSRWATTEELRAAGLLREAGVVLCQGAEARYRTRVGRDGRAAVEVAKLGALVRHDGPEHVFCFAPTRSGKGVGLVVPTLLSWTHSVLVYDIKKENWALTAGWRRQFSRVWRFEPTAIDSVRFNPLLEIRAGLSEVKDTQNVADLLVDPTGDKDSKDHWQSTAHTLLSGAILHVLYAEADKSLSGVAGFLSDPGRSQMQTLERMRTTAHLPSGPHPVVAQAAREMLNKSDNELSGVFSTAMACLGLYRDPVVARATSASDFRIADLMHGEVPASLYVVVPPSDLVRTRPLVRLLLNQIGRRLTESLEGEGGPAQRHRLLLLLDEFPSLGRLEFFETALAFLAGYGLKAFLIAQSLNQLEKAYGPNNSILDNCHVRLTYAANDDKTARRISDLLGQATERKLQRSFSGSGLFLTSRTESEQEYARALLTPAEVNQLPADDAILLVGGLLPYRGRKVRYFLDGRFRGREKWPPPDGAQAQARELPAPRASDWDGRVIEARAEAASEAGAGEPGAGATGATTSPAAAWGGYFEAKKDEDDDGEGPASGGDLPL
jgi:type IV secretion system protein VirD4